MFLLRQSIKERLNIQEDLKKEVELSKKQLFILKGEILSKINKQKQNEKTRQLKEQKIMSSLQKMNNYYELKLFFKFSKQIMCYYKFETLNLSEKIQNIKQSIISLYISFFKSYSSIKGFQIQSMIKSGKSSLDLLLPVLIHQLVDWSRIQHEKFLKKINEQLAKLRNIGNSEDKIRNNDFSMKNGKITDSSINRSVQYEKNQKLQLKIEDILRKNSVSSLAKNYQYQTKQILFRCIYPQLKSLYNNFRSILSDLDYDYLRQFSKWTKSKSIENIDRMVAVIIKADQCEIKNQIDMYANNYPNKFIQKNKIIKFSEQKIDLNQLRTRKKSEQLLNYNDKVKVIKQDYSKRLQSKKNIPEEIQTVSNGYMSQKQKQLYKIINHKHLEINHQNFRVFRNRMNQQIKYSQIKFLDDFNVKQQPQLKKSMLYKSTNIKKEKLIPSPREKQLESKKKYIKIQRFKNQSFQSQIFNSKESLMITPNNFKKLQVLLPKI